MNTISTYPFAKNSKRNHMTSEASDLEWPALYAPPIFTLTSEWSGRSISMEKVATERNDEGEPLLWRYKPSDKSIDLTVEVFND